MTQLVPDEKAYIAAADAHNAENARLRADLARHNSSPPPDTDEAATIAFNREAENLNARRDRLNAETERLQGVQKDLLERRSTMEDRRSKTDRRTADCTGKQKQLDADCALCRDGCDQAALHARALVNALDHGKLVSGSAALRQLQHQEAVYKAASAKHSADMNRLKADEAAFDALDRAITEEQAAAQKRQWEEIQARTERLAREGAALDQRAVELKTRRSLLPSQPARAGARR